MKTLRRLLNATRAISPATQVSFAPSPRADSEEWIIRVSVSDIVLVETKPGTLNEVTVEVTKKIEAMSQRLMAAVRPSSPGDEPPSSK
jgi:hypothetical protein